MTLGCHWRFVLAMDMWESLNCSRGVTFVCFSCLDVIQTSDCGHLLFLVVVFSSPIFPLAFANWSGVWGHWCLLQWALLCHKGTVSFSPFLVGGDGGRKAYLLIIPCFFYIFDVQSWVLKCQNPLINCTLCAKWTSRSLCLFISLKRFVLGAFLMCQIMMHFYR